MIRPVPWLPQQEPSYLQCIVQNSTPAPAEQSQAGRWVGSFRQGSSVGQVTGELRLRGSLGTKLKLIAREEVQGISRLGNWIGAPAGQARQAVQPGDGVARALASTIQAALGKTILQALYQL